MKTRLFYHCINLWVLMGGLITGCGNNHRPLNTRLQNNPGPTTNETTPHSVGQDETTKVVPAPSPALSPSASPSPSPTPTSEPTPIPLSPPGTLTFNSDTYVTVPNGTINLSWTSQNVATTCTLSYDQYSVSLLNIGTMKIISVGADTRFVLQCIGLNGILIEQSLDIRVVQPSVQLLANGVQGRFGLAPFSSATLTWTSQNVQSCTIDPLEQTGASGSYLVSYTNLSVRLIVTATCQYQFGEITGIVMATLELEQIGKWYNVTDAPSCSTYCQTIGLMNVASPGPENHTCASGENRPTTGLDAALVSYNYGIFDSGFHPTAMQAYNSGIRRYECYGQNQKVDHDDVDLTVACFCR